MSLFVKILGGRKKWRKTRQKGKVDKLSNRELLIKKTEFLRKKIHRERLCVKKNCRKNRKAALQALRRKKCDQLDCAVEAMRSAHEHVCNEMINIVTDQICDITEEEDVFNSHNSHVNQKVEFDEDELLAELDKLEASLEENLFEEDGDLSSRALPAASASHPAKMEDEDEDDLEYLRRWANDSLLEKNLDGILFAEDRTEDTVFSSPAVSTSVSSHPAKLEDGEDEDELEYLRRWVTERL